MKAVEFAAICYFPLSLFLAFPLWSEKVNEIGNGMFLIGLLAILAVGTPVLAWGIVYDGWWP